MSMLNRFFHRDEPASSPKQEAGAATCPHTALLPHWDSVSDMGHEDRATSFSCDSCGATFSPAEAKSLRASEAERLSMS